MFKEVESNFNKPAFTIVELLVVIVVIGILAAISIVTYNGVLDRARSVAIQSNLSNASKQLAMYHIYNGSYPYNASTLYDSQHHSLKGVSNNSAGTDPYHLLMYCTDGRDFVLALGTSLQA